MKTKSNQENIKSGKIRGIVLALLAVLAIGGLTVAMHVSLAGNPKVPNAEVNALFEFADTNKDGNISKEEFRAYLETRKTTPMKKETVRICPNTGEPCTGDGTGMCSSGNGEPCAGGDCSSGGEGGCCSGKSMGATTVQVKATNVKEVAEKKEGGCCRSKAGAEKKEGGCCQSKAAAEKKVDETTESQGSESE